MGISPPITEMIFTFNLRQKVTDLNTKMKNKYFPVSAPQDMLPATHDTVRSKNANCVLVEFSLSVLDHPIL